MLLKSVLSSLLLWTTIHEHNAIVVKRMQNVFINLDIALTILMNTSLKHPVAVRLCAPAPAPLPLTYLAAPGSDAVIQAEVVHLAVGLPYVQLGDAEVDPVAPGYADLPLAHRVVGVGQGVAQRRQGPAAGAQDTRATAISWRTGQKHPFCFMQIAVDEGAPTIQKDDLGGKTYVDL